MMVGSGVEMWDDSWRKQDMPRHGGSWHSSQERAPPASRRPWAWAAPNGRTGRQNRRRQKPGPGPLF
jgi:hypothetical protein